MIRFGLILLISVAAISAGGGHGKRGGDGSWMLVPEVRDAMKQCKEKDDDDKKCFAGCMMETLKLVNDNGEFNVENIVDIIHRKNKYEEEIARNCAAEVKENDACKAGQQYMKCVMSNMYRHKKDE